MAANAPWAHRELMKWWWMMNDVCVIFILPEKEPVVSDGQVQDLGRLQAGVHGAVLTKKTHGEWVKPARVPWNAAGRSSTGCHAFLIPTERCAVCQQLPAWRKRLHFHNMRRTFLIKGNEHWGSSKSVFEVVNWMYVEGCEWGLRESRMNMKVGTYCPQGEPEERHKQRRSVPAWYAVHQEAALI